MHFHNVNIADKALFVVGMPEVLPDMRSEVIDVVRDYSKANPWLELPDPYEIFPQMLAIGIVSWNEFKLYQRTHHCWPIVNNAARVLLRNLCETSPHEVTPFAFTAQSFDRPIQQEIDFC